MTCVWKVMPSYIGRQRRQRSEVVLVPGAGACCIAATSAGLGLLARSCPNTLVVLCTCFHPPAATLLAHKLIKVHIIVIHLLLLPCLNKFGPHARVLRVCSWIVIICLGPALDRDDL